MKTILLGVAAISVLAAGAPAAAQYTGGSYQNQNSNTGGFGNYGVRGNGGVEARLGNLQARIQAGVRSGAIDRREAARLDAQLRQLDRTERQYSRNGISPQERMDLQARIRNLREQIRFAEGRGQGRYNNGGYDDRSGNRDYDDRYGNRGYDDRYGDDRFEDRYGRNDDYQRTDRNGDGYDDRDYDRDGRWGDEQGRYGNTTNRGGILGGVLNSIFGGGGLRVGQRVSGNLYGVPSEYRGQFRDGNGVYYRSDGRQIYQIDARSQTVVRVFPMNR